jgi:hypothetical protein
MCMRVRAWTFMTKKKKKNVAFEHSGLLQTDRPIHWAACTIYILIKKRIFISNIFWSQIYFQAYLTYEAYQWTLQCQRSDDRFMPVYTLLSISIIRESNYVNSAKFLREKRIRGAGSGRVRVGLLVSVCVWTYACVFMVLCQCEREISCLGLVEHTKYVCIICRCQQGIGIYNLSQRGLGPSIIFGSTFEWQ